MLDISLNLHYIYCFDEGLAIRKLNLMMYSVIDP